MLKAADFLAYLPVTAGLTVLLLVLVSREAMFALLEDTSRRLRYLLVLLDVAICIRRLGVGAVRLHHRLQFL